MTLLGVDVSGWNPGINFAALPADFTIIKATGGNGFTNPYCDAQWHNARAAGTLTGIYHFAHEAGYQSDAVTEANFFVDQTLGYWDGQTLPVLDWEGDNVADVGWALIWLRQVFARTGVRPLIYMNTTANHSYNWAPVVAENYGLWIAQYAVTSPTYNYLMYDGVTLASNAAHPPIAYWSTLAMWQFADNMRLSGWSGGLDANVFYGDRSTWLAYCANASAPVYTPDQQLFIDLGIPLP